MLVRFDLNENMSPWLIILFFFSSIYESDHQTSLDVRAY